MGLNVVIVGGGLAGLAAAAFLRKQHRVTVLERGDLDFARNDYGISVLCNAYRLLLEAGLQEESLDCVPMIHLWSRNAQNESVQDFEFDTRKMFGAPTVLTRRSRLQAELYRLAISTDLAGEPAQVVQGVKIDSVDAEKGVVRDSTGREFSADLIIGADGINSVVRAAILSRDESDGTSGEAPAATHDLLAFVATLPLSHVQARQDFAWFSDPENNAGLVRWKANSGEKRGLLGYHINPREFQLYGYTTEDEFAAQFDDQNTTIIKGVSYSRAQSAFPDFTPALTDLFAHSNSGDGTVEAWRIRDIDPISQWSKGRTLLIGDAAHAITPHIGQGCNMAFEDAEALGYLLRDAKTVEDAQAVFPDFLKIRQTRAHEVAFSSRHHGNILKPEQAKEAGQFDLDGFRKRVYTYRGAEAELNAIKAA